jgi:hypothetical protein
MAAWIERIRNAFTARDTACRNRTIASVLFALSAVGPFAVWGVLLFTAVPRSQGPLEHAAGFLAFALTEAEQAWFYYVLAVLPFLLVYLSIILWLRRKSDGPMRKSFWAITSVTTMFALVGSWPSAIGALGGAYYAYRSDDG